MTYSGNGGGIVAVLDELRAQADGERAELTFAASIILELLDQTNAPNLDKIFGEGQALAASRQHRLERETIRRALLALVNSGKVELTSDYRLLLPVSGSKPTPRALQ